MVLEAATDKSDLSEYKRKTQWRAEAGADGAGGRKTGRNGADIILRVPVGTVAFDDDATLIADLDRPGARAVVARGGTGGRGNVHFKSSTRRAPDYAEPGLKGEERNLLLDLKLIADVGLVGPPNAGKSSLLRALTAAKPKVADYPFTTLVPELGVAESDAGRIVLADVPGLIEGAAQGAGLGQRFLRHVERTKVLIYVLDGAVSDPWKQLKTIRNEVEQFSPELAERPHLVAVNKVDLETVRQLRAGTRRRGVMFVSALTGEGLPELMDAVARVLSTAPNPALPAPKEVTKLPVRPAVGFAIERKGFGFLVRGERVESLLERTNLDTDSGLARFQSELDRLGVDSALQAAGVQPGDTVRIGDMEFEYQP